MTNVKDDPLLTIVNQERMREETSLADLLLQLHQSGVPRSLLEVLQTRGAPWF